MAAGIALTLLLVPCQNHIMMPRRNLAAACSLLFLTSLASHAKAESEFAIGFGYTHVSLDDTSLGAFDDKGGAYFEPRFSFAPYEQRPQFRVGFGLGFSFFYDETDGSATVIDDDGNIFFADADDYEQLFLLTPELQLSWRQELEKGWLIEGGVGIGAIAGFYAAGEEFFGEFYDQDLDESDITWSLRPFIRAGYDNGRMRYGIEASYQWGGNLDFTNEIGGDVEQWNVGVFFAFAR